ncbi:hypothetical protein ISX56_35315, partial [Serratia ureilytica]|nr:hypothetical protein [Serratia ureilytica]
GVKAAARQRSLRRCEVVWRKAELSLQELRLDPAQGDIGSRLTALFDPRRVRPDLTRAPLLIPVKLTLDKNEAAAIARH